jgi:UDP-3-O-[3-hydroxymyristoyl] glucosamine N-acyltransferase
MLDKGRSPFYPILRTNNIYSAGDAVIVKRDFVPRKEISATLILVDDPYTSFTRLLEEYHKLISFQKTGVEEPSFMHETATVGKNIYRGAFSYIGSNARLGNNVKIYPHSYVGDNVVIGDNTIIHPGVKIYADTKIGNNCVIHSGAVIGSDGFGFAPQEDGSYKTIPQLGNVTIEDNVAIGGNTVIDCATLFGDSTLIRKGVKLDNLIQIAQNQSGMAGDAAQAVFRVRPGLAKLHAGWPGWRGRSSNDSELHHRSPKRDFKINVRRT